MLDTCLVRHTVLFSDDEEVLDSFVGDHGLGLFWDRDVLEVVSDNVFNGFIDTDVWESLFEETIDIDFISYLTHVFVKDYFL